MQKEVIKFDPKLSPEQTTIFLEFCKKIKRAIFKKGVDERQLILMSFKEEMNGRFSGKRFHSNTDLAFLQSLMLDLLLQDWDLRIRKQDIQLEMIKTLGINRNTAEEKAKTRRRHLLARDVQLKAKSVTEFIKRMEKKTLTTKGWQSIFNVMRDGNELKNSLDIINEFTDEEERLIRLRSVINPYIQIAEPEERCKETGLKLSEIWRYFRHTWINEYKSLPGRSISVLVRDAAAPGHPVIGIAALGSSVAQQTCRDKWIGWDGDAFLKRIIDAPSAKYGKWIIKTLQELITEVYVGDFLREGIIIRRDLTRPTLEKAKELRTLGALYKEKHINNPESSKFSADNRTMTWKQRAETNLYKSKRVLLIAELLAIRCSFEKHGFRTGSKFELENALRVADFRDNVNKLARKAKANHVGINMMDIIVCGSMAPYNHLLGGKLVCMMLLSPEINQFYNKKYAGYVSLIASSMNGKATTRKPQLVMLGTTSLYGAGSSQYNRIKIPAEKIGGEVGKKVEYKELGFSEGYGSFHFSSTTIKLADAVAGREAGRARVNSIFGEGANPLIRKLKDAMEYLKLDSAPILNHRNKRIVYGIGLAENFGDFLIGLSDRPKYLIPQGNPKGKSELIGRYWIERWLANRMKNNEVLQQVATHSLSYPITHGARVALESDNDKGNQLFQ